MDIGEIRLRNLQQLMKSRGESQAEFARQMKTNSAYVSQIITRWKGRRMGSPFARRIE
jgi:transcriptional regulator